MRYHCAAAILNLFPNIGEQLDFNDQNYLQSLAQPSRWPENYFRKISENPPDERLTELNRTKRHFNEKDFSMQRRITVRMAAELHDQLNRYAVGQGVTLSRAIRELIEKQKVQGVSRWLFR